MNTTIIKFEYIDEITDWLDEGRKAIYSEIKIIVTVKIKWIRDWNK